MIHWIDGIGMGWFNDDRTKMIHWIMVMIPSWASWWNRWSDHSPPFLECNSLMTSWIRKILIALLGNEKHGIHRHPEFAILAMIPSFPASRIFNLAKPRFGLRPSATLRMIRMPRCEAGIWRSCCPSIQAAALDGTGGWSSHHGFLDAPVQDIHMPWWDY